MSKYLLDTHIALWATGKRAALSEEAREAILSGTTYLSVVAYWEVTIKQRKGRLEMVPAADWWAIALSSLAATQVPIHADHVKVLWSLPDLHKDPFDRILIAQAIAEDLTLISTDTQIAKYASFGLRVIS